MRVAGIDEAGKGPVIGPMVICGVCCDEEFIERLERIGVKDSKRLKPDERIRLADEIRKICDVCVLKISAEEINELMESMTINDILRRAYVEIIRRLKPDVVYVDCPDVNPERFADKISDETGRRIIASHRADELYPIVSSASIIAKVERDIEIEKLKEIYGDFGSGYSSDKKTIEFLRKYIREKKKLPSIARKKWKTLKRIVNYTLLEFSN